ncbi:GNAT family N-acetyltransferase [Flavobacterium taihuense]|uniref:GNAT family N-acetyltransferase n=1 Tax=Flavobacterium taihuense TaxID=2857508 RepID=A0ABS6XXY3_9FLAO|nr:GNAT family N-acetyltransferase [Flavobacterium taihuense]MBW4361538.1 GNAT family N-acetyltransferase [Flavobacterium taihuense]
MQQLITIKECQKSQLDLLFEIALQTYNDSYPYLWSDEGTWYLDAFYRKTEFEKELSAPNVFYFLVYDARKIIGYLKLKQNAIPPYPQELCTEIEKLYLLKEYTGKGIGKTLIKFIISLSKEHCRPVVWLKVMESSPAKYLYAKYGFKQTDKSYLDYPAMKKEYRWLLTMVYQIEDISV